MENAYFVALIVHIFCAIIFLGHIFSDMILNPMIKKTLGEDMAQKVSNAISSRESKVMPICLLLLLLSGGFMMSRYINSDVGYFESNLQILLWVKIALAGVIFLAVANALLCFYVFKIKNPLGKYTHKMAFVLGIFIVFLAKYMFYA